MNFGQKRLPPLVICCHLLSGEKAFWVMQAVYPFLRYNTSVIDFWLANIVLPVETKQFPENLKATAWHLASGKVLISSAAPCRPAKRSFTVCVALCLTWLPTGWYTSV